ncbi:pilus (MSHA type) biogenesis protein MshL [Chitinimonas sp. JJ19]|uniref:pilus (MSHA type) biogenesis protein MshL n=1 Tax=Chitinimonas sp. JJ19 TaxID=3109352 RepID=UPI00300146A9
MPYHAMSRHRLLLLAPLLAAGCATQPMQVEQGRHVAAPAATPAGLPQLVERPAFLPKPSAQNRSDTYSVVVNNVPVRDLMFALARDAKLNVDVHPLITGTVTVNALNQTLPQILDRISRQIDMRYTLENGVLSVVPDRPYVKTYTVDYVNTARTATGKVVIATSVASTGGASGGGGSNSSSTEITNLSENKFWERLEANIRSLLTSTRRVTDAEKSEREALASKDESLRERELSQQRKAAERNEKLEAAKIAVQAGPGAGEVLEKLTASPAAPSPGGSDDSADDVFIHPETGVITVNASSREHAKVQEYLDRVTAGARRQVLIEATIVEVTLGDQYQAGIDWSVLKNQENRLNFNQNLTGSNPLTSAYDKVKSITGPLSILSYTNTASSLFKGADFNVTIKALEQFGKTKVLSSPKIMALNNQTAVLKVVDEKVYFQLTYTPSQTNENGTTTAATYTSDVKTVPVGMVMSVTPQISAQDMVSLNVRPTISRITGYKPDPAVRILGSPIDSMIPEIQVRELESTLTLADGQVAVLGGLIQDNVQTSRNGLPGLSRLPWGVGDLFSSRDDVAGKSELVIFMRPIVVRDPSLNGDLSAYRQYLPDDKFFQNAKDEMSVFNSGLTAH